MDKCKWYVSVDKTECGATAVAVIDTLPSRRGDVKKLKEPLPVCILHKAQVTRTFAKIRQAQS